MNKNWLTILTIILLIPLLSTFVSADSGNCSARYYFGFDPPDHGNIPFDGSIGGFWLYGIEDTTCVPDCFTDYDIIETSSNIPLPGEITPSGYVNTGDIGYYPQIGSFQTGIFQVTIVLNDTDTGRYCYNTQNINFGNVSTCTPPKNPKQTWVITDDQVCINQTLCKLNNINITDTGSLTLVNTTLQFNLQSLYNFFITGYFTMDKDSTLLPPFASCGSIIKPYPVLAKIIAAEEISILPILFLTMVIVSLMLV